MNLIIILCVAHVVWAEQLALYHVKSKAEYRGPDTLREDSFFGFSTTYDRFNKKLVISAPRENGIGEVYTCELTTSKTCSKFGRNIEVADKYTHDYWFGATVRSSSNSILACAPRFTRQDVGGMAMHGQCYRREQSDDKFTTDVRPGPRKVSFEKLEHDMETLGWSLDIGPKDYVIVGGPGMYRKKGQTVFAQSTGDKLLRMDNLKTNVAFNFGYSVAIGYFLSENHVSYAVGSTYGTRGPGQVYIYTFNEHSIYESEITLKKVKDSDLVGSMFGAVLCAASLNRRVGVNASDLLVGAPAYAEKSGYNFGAVYVYVFRGKRMLSPKYNTTIKGQSKGALFGSAIISLGDLNGDGADEIAIGAPYEGEYGRGAVYLYSGAAIVGATNLTWLQKLEPEDQYRSFGFSLAALRDFDENGCNELAVGAPYVNKVILYRCMTAVTISELSATFPSFQNRTKNGKTEFQFKVCIKVQYPPKPKAIRASLSTDVQITHSDAKLSAPNKGSLYNFVTVLDSKPEEDCTNVGITLPLNGRYTEEIIYNISTTLMNDPTNETNFDGSRVILSDVSKFFHSGLAWAAECKNNKECVPNLKLQNIDHNIKDPYIIGSSNKEVLTFKIVNTGEVAYDPCFRITVVGAKVFKPTDYCTKISAAEPTWECTPMKPVLENETWIIDGFILELKDLTSKDTTMSISTTLMNNCRAKTAGEQRSISFRLLSATKDVSISGRSNYGKILNMTQDDLLNNGKRLEHTYEITNQGVTNFVYLTAIIKLPKEVYISYPTPPVTYDIDNSLEIKSDNGACVKNEATKTEMIVTCELPSLPRQSNVKVISYIDITAGSQAYETILGRNVTLNTSLELFLTDRTLNKRLSTIVTYQSASVALWILVLASLVGICLIIILALILYECGFLRRKNKEDLEKLKTSVRRQTIRRSMMQQSQADDRLNILERMEEVDENPVDVQQPHP